jgi:cardiolipin synthase C
MITIAAAALFGLGGVRFLNPLPPLDDRAASTAAFDTDETTLGRALRPLADAHPGTAGIHALANAHGAFAARVLLARAAERSLDVQYYIWRNDTTGTRLFEALHSAAERGVRVRLLLDDNNTSGLDGVLAALDSHPNFDAAPEGELTFTDLDVLAVGPIVRDVSNDFDRYWSSDSSYPADRLLPAVDAAALDELRTSASLVERDPAAAAYVDAVRDSPFVTDLLEGRLAFEWAPARMISDDPAKGLGRAAPESLLPHKLQEALGELTETLDVVSPYFVPTASGVDAFTALADRGVRVRVLVNSLEATDVDAVHSGYAKRRKPLLEAGIRLYEMQLVPTGEGAGAGAGPFGSSASSLHAKTFTVDRARLFIGSFNFDPRSAALNTELGFVIESTVLAARLSAVFDDTIPEAAYEVHLSSSGALYWTEKRSGELVRHDTEPGTSLMQRAFVRFLSWLPIEWLL